MEKHRPKDGALARYRAEAAELLGLCSSPESRASAVAPLKP